MAALPTKHPDGSDLEDARRDHLARIDAAISRTGGHAPEFRQQKPASFAKLDEIRIYVLSDDYDPDTAELMVAAVSAAPTAQAVGVSITQGKKAKKKGPAYEPRNELLKAIARLAKEKRPLLAGEGRDKFIRKLIVEALDRLDGLEENCRLDEWFGDDSEEIYNERSLDTFRIKSTGEVISAKSIGNTLSTLK